jgi:hypothetical protein
LRPPPQPLVRTLLVLFVGWAAAALVHEGGAALAGWDARQVNQPPCTWRLGMAPAERFRRCLGGVEGWLPAGSTIIFVSSPGPCSAEFFRWRWAAYLLPDLDVVPPDDPAGRQPASYLVAYRAEPVPPPGTHLVLLRQLAGGRLFRIHRP